MTNPLVGHTFGEPWTIDDLSQPIDDGNRYEIVDGSLVVSPAPSMRHARATIALDRLLQRSAPPDFVVSDAGIGVNVKDGRTYFIPDLIVFRRAMLDTDVLALDPADVLLVAEVLSPSNPGNDLVTKRHYYAVAAIPNYWIVNQDDSTLTVLRLDETGRRYHEHAVAHAGETFTTDQPFPVSFDPAEIF
jgi:Uma2 family endonuclease